MFKTRNVMRERRIRDLADHMISLAVGDQLTHEMIFNVTGLRPCPNDLYQAAHDIANREAHVYFDSVRGVGYVRRPTEEWESVTWKYLRRARNQVKKGGRLAGNLVKDANLSDEEQRRAGRQLGLLTTIAAMTRRERRS